MHHPATESANCFAPKVIPHAMIHSTLKYPHDAVIFTVPENVFSLYN